MLTSYVLGETVTANIPPDARPFPVERAKQFMTDRLEADPASTISLADLAEAASVTPADLCRLFKSSTGKSPIETVWLARMDRAISLVARNNYSLKEIGKICGYSSAFHLSPRTSRAPGQLPRSLRHRIGAGKHPPMSKLLHGSKRLES